MYPDGVTYAFDTSTANGTQKVHQSFIPWFQTASDIWEVATDNGFQTAGDKGQT